MAISQTEYEFLMSQIKYFDDLNTNISFSPAPVQWSRQINSVNTKDTYTLDFYRGSFELSRYTFNKRYRQTNILFRYDNGGRHTNPDGVHFDGPHVHIYKEGYQDKFAYPIDDFDINLNDSIDVVFKKLMDFCNVTQIPNTEIPMF